MFDLKVHNQLKPAKGKILITEPFLDDEYFSRAVILLCEHNEEGSFGFVLNNFVDFKMNELTEFPEIDTKISLGGPVGTKNLYFIHTAGNLLDGSILISDGIYYGGDFNQLKKLYAAGVITDQQVRFFLGYSGWTANQLEGELKQHSWLVSDIIDSEYIMNVNYPNVWNKYMSEQGGKYKAFSHFPTNPGLN